MQRQLFVTGWPRDCVLDAGMLLNEHPDVVLGIERFGGVGRLADPFLLAPERLLAPLSAETGIRGELLYTRLRDRARERAPEIVGDVDTEYIHVLDRLEFRLGHNRALVVLGEPTSSELDRWRLAVQQTRTTERTRFAQRVFTLLWEPFVAGDQRWLHALLGFLGLPPTDRIEAEHRRLCAVTEAGATGRMEGDGQLLTWLHARAAAELDRHAHARRPLPAQVSEPALTDEERDGRAREKAQLSAERGGGSVWPDESEALTVRYREQIRNASGRGRRIVTASLASGSELPAAELKVSLLSPELQPHALGRAHVTEQLATHLARVCTVRLFVTQPRPVPLPDVQVLLGRLSAAAVDEGEIVIYPAAMQDARRLLEGHRAVMLMDGFDAPDDQTVMANLADAREVIATSHWLCALAREHGARAIYLPLGLDRGMFARGPGAAERAPHVTGVAQTPEWLGCALLSDALVRVREQRPEVSVTLVGGVPADGATSFVSHPPVAHFANILRSSAVHVVSARKEGFGYLGAGALACGAALVTTDVDGSAEYAIDGRTALLAAPDDPQRLADRILTLLDDAELRARLAQDGGDQVRCLLPSWSETARRLALLLTTAGR